LAFSAGASLSQDLKSGDWATSDGGVVVVKANGGYDLAITDESNEKSIFSTGKVVDRKVEGGKVVFTLKPAAGSQTFVIEVTADGSGGELYVIEGGSRHKAATLTK
jgi:hypothetical protein